MSVDLSGLPATVVTSVTVMEQDVAHLLQPYTEDAVGLNPTTLQMETIQRTVTPRVEIRVSMPAQRTVQVIVQRMKPLEAPVLLHEFTGDDFDALNDRIVQDAVSWESFMEQAVSAV